MWPIVVLAALVATPARPAARAAAPVQVLVGLQGDWNDLDTWTHAFEDSHETELGLGLQPAGPGGTMLVAFLGRLDTRSPRVAPREITVQLVAPHRANPNTLRSATLRFILQDDTGKERTMDVSRRLIVDNIAPGAAIEDGVARISANDFVALTQASALSANVLGFDVVFRPDQIRAMQALAVRLHLR
jgi:hypothetical protein